MNLDSIVIVQYYHELKYIAPLMKDHGTGNEIIDLLQFLYQKRKLLIVVVMIAGLLSILVTSILPKKYSAHSVFFPPAFNSADQGNLNPQMGYNIEADRLIQMAQSSSMKDSLIAMFDLLDYYQIDAQSQLWRDKVYKAIDHDLTFERTKYMSVIVSFESEDPELAAEVVNELVNLLSRFWERLYKDNIREPLEYAQNLYLQKNMEIAKMLDSIHRLRFGNMDQSLEKLYKHLKAKESNVNRMNQSLGEMRNEGAFFNYGDQLDQLQLELIETQQKIAIDRGRLVSLKESGVKNDTLLGGIQGKINGNLEAEKLMTDRITKLQKTGKDYEQLSAQLQLELDQYHQITVSYENLLNAFEPNVRSLSLENLESRYETEKQVLNELKGRYERAMRYFNQPLPNLFVVEYATPSFRKVSPSYRLNLIVSSFVSFVLTALFLLFRKKWTELSQKAE